MNPALQRIEESFVTALELPDPAQRQDFLDRECAVNVALRAEVARLVSSHAAAERFFAEAGLQLHDAAPTVSETS